ncbi:MAG: amino acid adenylation domain-containing protein [Oligoflexia bacterium]|nr:amino acid adenylation domain-containing protein [Oligoflexia bacterium]
MQHSQRSSCRSGLVQSRFEAIASLSPQTPAIYFNQEVITYGELNSRANQLAQHLQIVGVAPKSHIGIMLSRSPEMIVSLLAVLKVGAAYVPLDPNYPSQRLNFMLSDSGCKFILAYPDQAEKLSLPTHGITLIDPTSIKVNFQETKPFENSDLDTTDLAYLLYTSGSTGLPKGVQIEHASVVNFLDGMARLLSVTSDDRFLATTTICFDISILEIFIPLHTGAAIILSQHSIGDDPQLVVSLLEKHQVTKAQATPSGWRMLLATGWKGSAKLDILSGGEALSAPLASELLKKSRSLWNLYGPTEATVWASAAQISSASTPISIGKPLPNYDIHLIDQDGTAILGEGPGELCISGQGLARGYLNRPELNAEKFLQHPSLAQRLYRTGDLARRLTDGSFEFLGRIDNQVKLRGHRIELGEIDAVLEQHALVQEACCVVRKENGKSTDVDGRLIAYVATGPGSACSDPNSDSSGLSSWRTIWDNTYLESNRATDPRFNISGWNDSYTGLPLPAEHVREWVETTVQRLVDLKPSRVLEIGCGTGLLLFRIAPLVEKYHGTDISEQAIRYVERHLGDMAKNVTLSATPAHEIPESALQDVDLVIINSVLQYFPGSQYLIDLLTRLARVLPDGARIFLGDVRNLDLLNEFHLSVQLEQSPDSLDLNQLRQRIERRSELEQGLLLSPRFFLGLSHHIPRLALSRIALKRGRFQNELTRFRYDAVVEVGASSHSVFAEETIAWGTDLDGLGAVDALLARPARHPLYISGIPNARLLHEARAKAILNAGSGPENVGALRDILAAQPERDAVEPETIQVLAKGHECYCHLVWNTENSTLFDAIIIPKESGLENLQPPSARMLELLPLAAYANTPAHPLGERQIISELRTLLSRNLPEYMLPSAIVVMKRLPHTPSGKIDRKALPEPPSARPSVEQPFVAARSPVEAWISEQWRQLLGVDSIGVLDNFFESGGDSLLIVGLVTRVEKQFRTVIGLGSVFENPSISAIAEIVEQVRKGMTAIRRGTSRDELLSDINLPDSFWVKPKLPVARLDNPQVILLTGASGFLGAFLLHTLLTRTYAKIECLVRARSTSDAMRRIRANLSQYGLWRDEFNPRCVPRVGDLSQPKFGLNPQDYAELATSVDVIIHNGATVNLLFPYSILRAPNVQGTREILDLAVAERLKRVHFVSSLAVLESPEFLEAASIAESSRTQCPELLSGGYAQSKWVGEELVREAMRRGVPCSISRPASICHDQPVLEFLEDLPGRFLQALAYLGTAPNCDWTLDLTSVSRVALSITSMALSSSCDGETAHLVTPQKVGLRDLLSLYKEHGVELRTEDLKTWKEQLISACQRDKNFPLAPLISLFTEADDSGRSYFEISSLHLPCSTEKTNQLLSNLGLTPAPPAHEITRRYLSTILNKANEQRWSANS